MCVENVGDGLALLEQLADKAAQRGLVCLLMTAAMTPEDEPLAANRTMMAFPHDDAALMINVKLPTPSHRHIELTDLVRRRGLSPFPANLIAQFFTNAFVTSAETDVTFANCFLILSLDPNKFDELSDLESSLAMTHSLKRH